MSRTQKKKSFAFSEWLANFKYKKFRLNFFFRNEERERGIERDKWRESAIFCLFNYYLLLHCIPFVRRRKNEKKCIIIL